MVCTCYSWLVSQASLHPSSASLSQIYTADFEMFSAHSVVYVVTETLLTIFEFIKGDTPSQNVFKKFVTEFSHKILFLEHGQNVTTQVHT